jgi:hypothetical protein
MTEGIESAEKYAGRAHLLPAQQGWEEIADYALEWAISHAQAAATRARASSA